MATEITSESEKDLPFRDNDSINSSVSFISASNALDDTFETKFTEDVLEKVTNALKHILSKHPNFNYSPDISNASGLVSLLEESLDDYRNQIEHWKQTYELQDVELTDLRILYEDKMNKLLEENRSRVSSIVSGNEKQLSTTLERAVNSRRQAEILQSQLNEARSRIASLEQKFNNDLLNSAAGNSSQCLQCIDERKQFKKQASSLEDEVQLRRMANDTLIEQKQDLMSKLNKQMMINSEILKESEDTINIYQSRLESMEKELSQERKLNKKLWEGNTNSSREIAALKAKLEAALKELDYRNRMYTDLKEENRATQELNQDSNLKEIEKEDDKLIKLNETLKEKKKMSDMLETQLNLVKNSLKKKSVEIQMNSDRVASFNQKLKHLEEQILSTSTTLSSKESDINNLNEKLKERERQFKNLARKSYEGRVKTMELDTSLKLYIEKERTLSNKLRSAKKEEAQLENDLTLYQSRNESLLKVLQSRKNIIEQLENEEKKSEARLTQLFNKALPNSDTYEIEESKPSYDYSLISNISAISDVTESPETSVNTWQNQNSETNYKNIDMSLCPTLHGSIICNTETSDLEHGIFNQNMNETQVIVKSEMPSQSDTDSGVSIKTEGIKAKESKKYLQSTPVHNEPREISHNDVSSVSSSSDKYNQNLTTRPAVSINIYQATGRVRHNSLPSSAGKNRLRYKTKLQECLPNCNSISSQHPTHEQGSQTTSSSFLESYKFRRESLIERLPADGVEPFLNK